MSRLVLSVLLVACASATAHADDTASADDVAAAKEHYARAIDHQASERYPEAVVEYLAAYELYASPELLYNVGEVYRLAGDDEAAVDYFGRYLELDPEGRGAARARRVVDQLSPPDPEPVTAPERVAVHEAAPEIATMPSAVGSAPVAKSSSESTSSLLGRGGVEGALAISFPAGRDEDGDADFGEWARTAFAVRFGITDVLEVGAHVDLAPMVIDDDDYQRLGSASLGVGYRAFDHVAIAGRVGLGAPGAFARSPFDAPMFDGDMEPAVTVGIVVHATARGLEIVFEPAVIAQAESNWADGGTLVVGHAPVSVSRLVGSSVRVGVRTGVYSGASFSVSPADDATIPLIGRAAMTAAGGSVDIGLEAGFANLVVPYGDPVTDSLFAGIFTAWRR